MNLLILCDENVKTITCGLREVKCKTDGVLSLSAGCSGDAAGHCKWQILEGGGSVCFCDHADLLARADGWLTNPFRLPRAIILELRAELGSALERRAARNRELPVPIQILTTLGFLATGAD